MKTLPLAAVSALAGLTAIVAASDSAKAQTWMDIARQPVPSFSASRGYTGDNSYYGPEMYIPGNLGNPLRGGAGSPVAAVTGGGGGGVGRSLQEAVEAAEEWHENGWDDDHDEDCY